MTATTLLLYAAAWLSGTVLPGPTMLLALSNGATGRARVVAAGIAGAAARPRSARYAAPNIVSISRRTR
jgi:threonine/homoserine/homoserine lactone efflux protein